MNEPILRIEDLDVSYGTSQALFGVSTDVAPGSVLAVLGANGAGKSTLARTVSGLVKPSGGRVFFNGHDITGKSAHRIRKLGLTYIPEGRGIFPGLTVIDNLKMAVAQEKRSERAPAIDRAIDLFPVLGSRKSQSAGSLSGGEQQMLALARAVAVLPKLIIADELSLGLAPQIVEAVFQSLDANAPGGGHDRLERAVRAQGFVTGRHLRDPHARPSRLGRPGVGCRHRSYRPLPRRCGTDLRTGVVSRAEMFEPTVLLGSVVRTPHDQCQCPGLIGPLSDRGWVGSKR